MLRRILLTAACIIASACTENHVTSTIIENGDGGHPTNPTPVPATIKVSPDSIGLVIPATYTFAVTATDKSGKATSVTWSSQNPSIARVDAKTGLVTSVAPGLASITAVNDSDATVKYTVKVSVTSSLVPATIKVSPDSTGVVLPASYTYSGVATGKDGKLTTITWSSSNTAVARIDAKTGVVTSVAAGLVSITATNDADSTVKYTVKFSVAPTVQQPVPATVKVTPDSTSILVLATYTYSAAATDKSGKPTTVTWSSSNSAVARIDAKTGIVTGVAPGTVVITATNDADTTVKASVKLTVGLEVQSITMTASLPAPSTLTLSGNVYVAKVGTTADFDVTVSPSNYTFTCGTDNAGVALFNAVTVNGVKKCRATFVSVSPLGGVSPVQVWAQTTTAHTFPNGTQAQLQAGVQIRVVP